MPCQSHNAMVTHSVMERVGKIILGKLLVVFCFWEGIQRVVSVFGGNGPKVGLSPIERFYFVWMEMYPNHYSGPCKSLRERGRRGRKMMVPTSVPIGVDHGAMDDTRLGIPRERSFDDQTMLRYGGNRYIYGIFF